MLMNLNTPVLSRFQRKALGSIPDSKEWAPLPEVPKLVHSEGPNPVVHCSPLKTWLFGRWKHMSFTVSCYIMLILRRPHGSTKKIAMPHGSILTEIRHTLGMAAVQRRCTSLYRICRISKAETYLNERHMFAAVIAN